MKNLFIVVLAALTLPLVGCKYENSSPSATLPVLLWSEQSSGGQLLRTEYEWGIVDGFLCVVGEEQTDSGVPVYTISDYKYRALDPLSYTKTIYLPVPTTERHQITYYGSTRIQSTYDIYHNNETEPSQWMKREISSTNQITREESLDGEVHTVKSNFKYDSSPSGGYTTSYDVAVTIDGVTENHKVLELYGNNDRSLLLQSETRREDKLIVLESIRYDSYSQRVGYEKWEGDDLSINSAGNVTGGYLVVKQDQFSSRIEGSTQLNSYTTTEYVPGTTNVAKSTNHRSYWETRTFDLQAK